MKVLQLCNKVPFPPKDGGCIAMNNLTQGLLLNGAEMKVLSINTEKHYVSIEKLPDWYKTKTHIEAVFVDTKVSVTGAVISLIKNKSYNLSRFYSEDFSRKLIETLNKEPFDIIQIESIYVAVYIDVIKKYSNAKIIIRSHNIENTIWSRKADFEKNILKKLYLNILAKQLQKEEIDILKKADWILTITENDLRWIKSKTGLSNIKTIPFGVNPKEYSVNKMEEDAHSLFFIGAFDWFPNVDGMNWFLENVWNKLLSFFPDIKLYIAGRSMPDEFKKNKQKNVFILGEIEDAGNFISSKGIMIIPLFAGGGMRVKIIEGMAYSKAIVSTTIGAEGIEAEQDKNILIADTAEEFVLSIKKLLSDKVFYDSMKNHARNLIEQKYNNHVISLNLFSFYNSILNNK